VQMEDQQVQLLDRVVELDANLQGQHLSFVP
jgi:hypothetical protein